MPVAPMSRFLIDIAEEWGAATDSWGIKQLWPSKSPIVW